MIERHYGRYIKDDGDAPLRALLERKSETLNETFLTGGEKYLGFMVRAGVRGHTPQGVRI